MRKKAAVTASLLVMTAVVGVVALRLRQAPQAAAREAPPALPSGVGPRPLRVAMSAAFVSEAGVPVYGEIVDYLAQRSGAPLELITGLGYSTITQMLEAGAVEYGFICGYPYILAHDQPTPKVELVAAPVMKDPRYLHRPVYFSDLIVQKDSPLKSIKELHGLTYVYNEETSNSGYNMPRAYLVQLGLTKGYFGKVLRSGSHEESIRMVATGLADASFVDSLVLDYDRVRGLGHAADVRVIDSLGPVATVPFVVSSAAPATARGLLKSRILTMHEDAEGRKILDKALVERFADVADSDYDAIRAMKKSAEDAAFMEIK